MRCTALTFAPALIARLAAVCLSEVVRRDDRERRIGGSGSLYSRSKPPVLRLRKSHVPVAVPKDDVVSTFAAAQLSEVLGKKVGERYRSGPTRLGRPDVYLGVDEYGVLFDEQSTPFERHVLHA